MPDYRGLTIRFDGDASGLIAALREVDSATGRTTSMLSRINTALQLDPKNANLYTIQVQEMAKQVDAARTRLVNLNTTHKENSRKLAEAQQKLNKLNAEGKQGTDEWRQQKLAVQEYSEALSTNEAEIELATVKLNELVHAGQQAAIASQVHNSDLGQLSIGLREWGEDIDLIGEKLQRLGGVLTIGTVTTLLSAGRSIISETEEYGNAISKVGGYLDLSGEQLEHMSDLALQFGKDTRYSAVEAADAISELAKGGMTQAQIEGGALNATLQLASAGNIGLAEAAEVAVQAINVFKLSAADSSQIADALAGAANRSTAEVDSLSQAFKYVSGWSGLAEYSINDVSGALGLLSDHGLQAEMAGTALRNFMQRIAAPTDTAKKVLDSYGLSAYDAEGKMKPLVQIVGELGEAFEGVNDETRNADLNTIFGARGLPAAIALMEAGTTELEDYIDATKRVGYAEEMAQAQMGDLGWALEYLRGEFETFQVNLGSAFTPILVEAAGQVENLLTQFNELSKSDQERWAKGIVEVATLGPKLLVVGTALRGFAVASKGLSTWYDFQGAFESAKDVLGEGATVMERFGSAVEYASGGAVSAEKSVSLLSAGVQLLGVAAAAYVAIKIWQSYQKDAEHLRKYDEVIDRLSSHASAADVNLGALSEGVEEVGTEAKDTVAEVEELLDSVINLYDTIEEENQKLATDSTLLNDAFAVIQELGGQGNLSTEQLDSLAAALQVVNGELGTSYALHSDTGGVIYDENDAVVTLTSSIGALIEAKKAEMRAEVLGGQYKRLYEQRAEAAQTVADAEAEATRQAELFYETLGGKAGYVDGELISVETVREANDALAEAQSVLGELDSALLETEQAYGAAERAAQNAANGITNALEENIDSIDGLNDAFKESGMSVADFVGFTTSDFAKMERDCSGNVNDMIGWLRRWRDTKAADKQVKVTANTSNATSGIENVRTKLSQLKDRTVNIRTNVIPYKQAYAAGGIRPHADGGIRPHADGGIATYTNRYHAGGSIVNVPGTGYPLDWVGEAGAEAIVPLTNKRYSQPFVDLIADGVAQRMGGGTSYNLYINGARVNDDPQIRGQFIDLMTTLARKGAMNVGGR